MHKNELVNTDIFKELHQKACVELEKSVDTILGIVSRYSPISILKRCYEEIAICSLQKENSTDDSDTELLINSISYLQSIIYSTTPSEEQIETIDEDVFQELIQTVKNIYMQTNMLLMGINSDADNISIEELKIKSRLEWVNVKGKRYRYFECMHLKELLLPHNEIFTQIFNISVDDFITNIKKIEYFIIRGYFESWEIIREAYKDFCKISNKNPDANIEDLIELQKNDDKLSNAFGKAFGYNLFDLEQTTELPKQLLEKLSSGVGVNKYFGSSKYAYLPIKNLPINEKPFLKYQDRYYCFEIQSLYDNLYRNIEKILLQEAPNYQDKWNKIQGKVCQNITVNLFKNILPSANYFENNYYLSKQEWIENDLLITYDKVAIIIEIKAGKFKTKSPITDYINYEQSVSKLLEAPLNQAYRVLEQLRQDSSIVFYKNNKNQKEDNQKYVLEQNNFDHIFLCSISLDNFNIIANNINLIKEAGFAIPEVPIWGVSIDELRVYSHLFENDGLTFLHFLLKRVKASQSSEIDLNDELDHLALYFEFNDYIQFTEDLKKEQKINNITYFAYTREIDDYFCKQEEYFPISEKMPKPQQKMPVELRELINIIQTKEDAGCFHVISSILDFSGNGRDYLVHLLKIINEKQFATKRLQHLNIIDISAFCIQDDNIIYTQSQIDDFVYASMLIANQPIRYCLKIYFNSENKMYNADINEYTIEINTANKIKYAEVINMLLNARINSHQNFKKEKIGRNDLCPCGSGKKYKKCCLKYFEN